MRDRITTKDALVFIALSEEDLAGIYWMIWEAMMMMSGVKAFQYWLDYWIEHRTRQAALPHLALGQDLTPSPLEISAGSTSNSAASFLAT
jgi:hypothetical protein